MKFIHTADIHLDSAPAALKDFYGTSSFSISEKIQRAFISLVDFALKENVHFILIAGDLFDSNWKDYRVGLFFLEQIQRISCPIFYIRGNHDSENRWIKKLPFPKNFIEFSSKNPQTHLLNDLKVAIHGQSYAHYHMIEDLSEAYPKAIPGFFNIGLLHTSGDIKLGKTPYAPYQTESLIKKGYDYWAFGHLHDFQVLQKTPFLIYPGNLQGRHIRECGPKGCCYVKVESSKRIEVEFTSLSELQWVKIDFDLSPIKNESELKKKLLKQIETHFKFNLKKEPSYIVRLKFFGVSHLKLWVEGAQEHLQHQIHCWFQEHFNGHLRLEKIENSSKPYKSFEELKKQNPFIEIILKDLQTQFQCPETFEHFKRLLGQLQLKMPKDLLKNPHFLNQEEKELFSAYFSRVEEMLYEHLLEAPL